MLNTDSFKLKLFVPFAINSQVSARSARWIVDVSGLDASEFGALRVKIHERLKLIPRAAVERHDKAAAR